jgi:asparagine synthase (glutamine-hydrolysing)
VAAEAFRPGSDGQTTEVMCGIAGIADPSGRPVDAALLKRMCDAMVHRGPDDEGYHLDPETSSESYLCGCSVGLAMRRLAIIDLRTGKQPIHNEDRTIWVVLNGEIYNYRELRAELERRGHGFSTHSDTEVIVHAYEEYGLDVPRLLRGMFAFALWDARRRSLLLARDRIGKKPLLYCMKGGKLIFASEFQALLEHPEVPRAPDQSAIWEYISFGYVPAPKTAFRGVRKLKPGHTLVWQNGQIRISRYWELDFSRKIQISLQEASERLLELLRDAVRVRLVADVPIGAFLSGGIDSSAVVAFMNEFASGKVKTFSIGFQDQDFSELGHARRVAERFQTDHHEMIVRPDVAEVLPILVRHYGEPYADSSAIPTYYLAKMTRQHVTVALNGDGGDECFAGYERYVAMRLAELYRRLPRSLGRLIIEPAIAALPQSGWSRSKFGRARRFLGAIALPGPERYLKWISVFDQQTKLQLCTPQLIGLAQPDPLEGFKAGLAGNGQLDMVDRALMADTIYYLPNDLLVKVDIASMAASLEARSPFLDHHLMEFAASLPAEYKLRGMSTKYLLKRALRGILPEENLCRRKMGFGVPVGRWMRNELKGLLVETLLSERALRRGYFRPEALRQIIVEHLEARRDHSHGLWALLMLELWHSEFID